MAADDAEVVRALWTRMQARDWDGVAALLADDFTLEWPQTRERIRGPADFVAVNRNYPGDWAIEVERVWDAGGGRVASQVRVPIDGRVEYACSFFDVRGGRIARAVEFWGESSGAPEWRRAWVEPMA